MDAISVEKTRAVVIAIRSGDEVLLVSKSSAEWGFPGGRLGIQERVSTGAKRKIRHEIGISLGNARFNALGEMQSQPNPHTLYFLGIQLPSGTFSALKEIGPNGHKIMRCQLSHLHEQNLKPDHVALIKRLHSR